MVAVTRPLIFGHFHQETAALAFSHAPSQHERSHQRADNASRIEHEQHQPLQTDAPTHCPVRNESRNDQCVDRQPRSEEHTSELQSLMRISYAVFCLKKKTKKKN